MRPYLLLFITFAVETAVCVLLSKDKIGELALLTIIPGIVILFRENQRIDGRALFILAAVAVAAEMGIISTVPLKNGTLTPWTALAQFFAVIIFTLGAYGIVLAGVSIVRYTRRVQAEATAARKAHAVAIQSEFDQFSARVGEGKFPDVTSYVTGVVLRPNERCCVFVRNVQQIVNKQRTSYVGGSHGVSFRIAKGVRYHVGAYKGHRVTTVNQEVGDVGSLYVTDKRIIFSGTKLVVSVALKQIGDVRVCYDGLVVIQENKPQPSIFRFADRGPLVALAIRAMIDGQVQYSASRSG